LKDVERLKTIFQNPDSYVCRYDEFILVYP